MIKDKILIVEDERELRNALKLILEMYKFEVLAAANGLEGLEILRSSPVDLIVCDINLPDISGHDILEAVRNDKQLYKIPFIFLTAYADERDVRKGMNNGADDYITKPFVSKDLVSTIKARLLITKKKDSFYQDEFSQNWIKLINHNFKQEFMTPLNSIMNATNLLGSARHVESGIDFKDTINAIYVSSFRMFRNTRNLITYSILSQGKIQEHKNNFNDAIFVSDMLQQILDYYNKGLNYNYGLIKSTVDFVPEFNGSAEYLNIIFTELIDNAVRHDTNQFPPKVSLRQFGSGFEFTIVNTIAKDITFGINDIQQFRKFHEDLSLNGLGIGLYICKELSKRINCELSISIDSGLIKFTLRSNSNK